MINWVELNKDSLLGNILISALFMFIGYVFSEVMNNWKKKKKGGKGRRKGKSKVGSQLNAKHSVQKNFDNETHDTRTEVIREKTIIYVDKSQGTSDDNSSLLFIVVGFLLFGGVWLLNTYKDTISNTIYWIALFGLIFSLILLGREIKFPSTKGLKFLLGWTAFLWLCLMASMHLIYHPFYLSQEAITTQVNIQKGAGVLSGGLDGFFYLAYQLLGFLVSVVILIFNISAQIYTSMVWWNESSEIDYSFKGKIMRKVLKFLDRICHPTWKFVIFSVFLLLLIFGLESGFIMYLFDRGKTSHI